MLFLCKKHTDNPCSSISRLNKLPITRLSYNFVSSGKNGRKFHFITIFSPAAELHFFISCTWGYNIQGKITTTMNGIVKSDLLLFIKSNSTQ